MMPAQDEVVVVRIRIYFTGEDSTTADKFQVLSSSPVNIDIITLWDDIRSARQILPQRGTHHLCALYAFFSYASKQGSMPRLCRDSAPTFTAARRP